MSIFLETERLRLRRFTLDDADHLFALDSDSEVMRFINGGQPTPYETIREQILPRWLAYYEQYPGYGYWAAVARASGEFLGWFHFRPAATAPDAIDLGYRLRRSAWGHGYATEGARALIRKGFTELGTERVVAYALADNTASIRVMQKAGLRYVRTFRYVAPNAWHDGREAVEYALDWSEWASSAI